MNTPYFDGKIQLADAGTITREHMDATLGEPASGKPLLSPCYIVRTTTKEAHTPSLCSFRYAGAHHGVPVFAASIERLAKK